jgi:hypothetical protein
MSTIADRTRYQAHERALLADQGIDLSDEPPCRECGCSDSLACPQGCGWTQPDLCSACADELEASPTRSTSHRLKKGAAA